MRSVPLGGRLYAAQRRGERPTHRAKKPHRKDTKAHERERPKGGWGMLVALAGMILAMIVGRSGDDGSDDAGADRERPTGKLPARKDQSQESDRDHLLQTPLGKILLDSAYPAVRPVLEWALETIGGESSPDDAATVRVFLGKRNMYPSELYRIVEGVVERTDDFHDTGMALMIALAAYWASWGDARAWRIVDGACAAKSGRYAWAEVFLTEAASERGQAGRFFATPRSAREGSYFSPASWHGLAEVIARLACAIMAVQDGSRCAHDVARLKVLDAALVHARWVSERPLHTVAIREEDMPAVGHMPWSIGTAIQADTAFRAASLKELAVRIEERVRQQMLACACEPLWPVTNERADHVQAIIAFIEEGIAIPAGALRGNAGPALQGALAKARGICSQHPPMRPAGMRNEWYPTSTDVYPVMVRFERMTALASSILSRPVSFEQLMRYQEKLFFDDEFDIIMYDMQQMQVAQSIEAGLMAGIPLTVVLKTTLAAYWAKRHAAIALRTADAQGPHDFGLLAEEEVVTGINRDISHMYRVLELFARLGSYREELEQDASSRGIVAAEYDVVKEDARALCEVLQNPQFSIHQRNFAHMATLIGQALNRCDRLILVNPLTT